jgi:hypothetical protein
MGNAPNFRAFYQGGLQFLMLLILVDSFTWIFAIFVIHFDLVSSDVSDVVHQVIVRETLENSHGVSY